MIVRPLDTAPTVPEALRAVADLPHPILFDSAKRGPTGRWSFLAADPIATVVRPSVSPGGTDWMDELRDWSRTFAEADVNAASVPFTGGPAGVLSYDLAHAFERLQRPALDEFSLPAICVGVYDWVVAWDHADRGCRLISTGVRAADELSEAFAEERADFVQRVLSNQPLPSSRPVVSKLEIGSPHHVISEFPGVASNFTQAEFESAVEAVREHIAAGDIFQANLAQRLLAPAARPPVDQYLRLREVNAAPMAGYFDAGDWQLLSASPERFVELSPEGRVETRPIKGTLKRPTRPEADLYTRDALRESEKDRAENVMIVDLMRNDLSRVCETGSVGVPQLCEIETYETVQHLVSSVTGQLRSDFDRWDLIAGTFPGGSITGCPKIRAMDVITSLEDVARGPYCGSLFYASADGRLDASILIRTMIQRDGWLQLPVGGGITYASDPRQEYRETLIKAEAMVRSLSPA